MTTRVRPVAVVVVGVLMALNGVAALVATVPQFGGSATPRVPPGALLLNGIFGVALLFIAWGLFTLKSWAWTATIAIQAVSGISAIVTLVRAPALWPAALLDIAMAAVIIFLLVRPRVRAAFGRLLGPTP